jgi:hypothetical protein
MKNIELKLKRNATIIPSEVVIILRDFLSRLEEVEERLHALETGLKGRRRVNTVPEGEDPVA